MRTPMNPIAFFVATGLLSLVACDSDSGSSSGTTVAPNQIHEALAGLQCDLLTSCTQDGDSGIFATLIAASNKTACQAMLTRAFEWTGTDIEAQVASGALSYDGDKLAACFAQVRQSCDLDFLDACDAAFEGKVALGGVCESDLNCAGDANCVYSSAECGGTCRARVARGEACDFNGDCSQSAGPTACSFESSTCVAIVSELNREVGQRCDNTDDSSGYVRRTCKNGLACVDGEDGTATCQPPLAVGASCEETEIPCATGSFCLGAEGGAICQTLTITRTVGASCNHDPQAGAVVLCSVVDQLGCDAGKCKKWGDGTAGAYCSVDFETDFSCDRDFFCDGSQCQPRRAAGQPCESDSECASRWCDYEGETGTCAAETVCD